jgi:hypothetical protein
MITFRRKRLAFSRAVALLLIFLIAFPVSSSFIPVRTAQASDWAGWDAINKIYYDAAQDDANSCLAKAAGELDTYLTQMSGRSWTVVTNAPPAPPAVYLAVNASMLVGHGDEAFRLVVDSNGVTITGKTAFAARDGAYRLLDRLGVKWLRKGDIWTVVPTTLVDLGVLDVFEEPDFIGREVEFGPNPVYDWPGSQLWKVRNLGGSSSVFRISHSYNMFLPAEDYADYPNLYLVDITTLSADINDSVTTIPVASVADFPVISSDTPVPLLRIGNETISYTARPDGQFTGCTRGYGGTTPASHSIGTTVYQQPAEGSTTEWQLKPDNADVISHALTFADAAAVNPQMFSFYSGEDIPNKVVPISPNDGSEWGTYSNKTTQELTDLIYGLTDIVAVALHDDYPDTYFGVYNYSQYSEVPTNNFTYDNVYAEIATAYDYTNLTDLERIAGLKARGATVGIREYYDIVQWYYDLPPSDSGLKKLNDLKSFADAGASVYRAEGCESWGSWGFIFWIACKLCWDSNQSIDDLLDEYCDSAFGAASEPMKRIYNRWLSGQHISDNSLAAAVADLTEAETLANGDEKILDRIRSEEYYIEYEWKYRTIDDLDIDELADLYSWVTKLRDLYILSYYYIEVDVFHDRLRDNFGMTEGQITTWMANNADYSLPTNEEAVTWLTEMQNEFAGIDPINAEYIDPYNFTVTALDNTDYEAFAPAEGNGLEVLVYANTNDIVHCELLPYSPYDDSTFNWYDPDGGLIDTAFVPKSRQWLPVNFTASAGTGLYKITGSRGINVLSHPAGILAGTLFSCDTYFYVPSGTPSVLLEFETGMGSCTLYDPNGEVADTLTGPTVGYQIMGVNNPDAGVWHLHYNPGVTATTGFRLLGVPGLVWHDPAYLLVEDTASPIPQPPVLNSIGNKTAYVNSLSQFTVSATDPNLDSLTYSASNLPPWATFNTTTRTFSGTPGQVENYYNVYFEVSDGALTDGEYITITVNLPGGSPDINRDGIVNALDVIRVIQHWGESGSNSWIFQDTNSDGKIDVLDIIVIGQHWTQ